MPTEPFKYDAFISYSSADRPWAKLLADELADRNFKIFFDRSSLGVGNQWEEELDDSIRDAQHMIVLWSGNSAESYWVDKERTIFHTKTRDAAKDPASPSRKQIVILLNDPEPIQRNYIQMIPELKESGSYGKPPDKRDVNAWTQILMKVDKTLRDQSNALRILVAVLATNRQFLESLDFDTKNRYFGSMNDVIAEMGIKSKADLLSHYGDTFNDWRPFGDEAKIWAVLDKLKSRVANVTQQKIQIEWEPIGPDLWSATSIEAVNSEAARLVKQLSLVVIDPISLLDENVREILDRIHGSYTNTASAIMVLTPFKSDKQPTNKLRQIIRAKAIRFSSFFYEPPVPPASPFANFGVNIGDEIDMNRLVLMSLGQYFGPQKPPNNFINP